MNLLKKTLTLFMISLHLQTQTVPDKTIGKFCKKSSPSLQVTPAKEVKKAQKYIFQALQQYDFTKSEQSQLMKTSLVDIKNAQSTSKLLLHLTLQQLSTQQAVDLMSGIYNQHTIQELCSSIQDRKKIY